MSNDADDITVPEMPTEPRHRCDAPDFAEEAAFYHGLYDELKSRIASGIDDGTDRRTWARCH